MNYELQEFDSVLLHIVTFIVWGHTYLPCKLNHRRGGAGAILLCLVGIDIGPNYYQVHNTIKIGLHPPLSESQEEYTRRYIRYGHYLVWGHTICEFFTLSNFVWTFGSIVGHTTKWEHLRKLVISLPWSSVKHKKCKGNNLPFTSNEQNTNISSYFIYDNIYICESRQIFSHIFSHIWQIYKLHYSPT